MGNSIMNTDKKMNTKVMSKMEELTGKYMPESVAENLQNYAGTEFNVFSLLLRRIVAACLL